MLRSFFFICVRFCIINVKVYKKFFNLLTNLCKNKLILVYFSFKNIILRRINMV